MHCRACDVVLALEAGLHYHHSRSCAGRLVRADGTDGHQHAADDNCAGNAQAHVYSAAFCIPQPPVSALPPSSWRKVPPAGVVAVWQPSAAVQGETAAGSAARD